MEENKTVVTEEVKKAPAKKTTTKKVATEGEVKAPAKKASTTTKKAAAPKAEAPATEEAPKAAKAVKVPVSYAAPKKEHTFLQKKYKNEIAPALMAKYNFKSTMEIPAIDKVVINMGVGDATQNAKLIEAAVADLETITGQKAIITKAKKSIATFKVREGQEIGCKVTLRGDRMYEFLNKLINIAIPRIRDFHGISSKAFDGRGNFTLGVKEQLIFPEINFDKVVKVRGMDIVIVTTAKNDAQGKELLKLFGMPFEK